MLCERTEHLVWKDKAFGTENPASNSEIDEMFKVVFFIIIENQVVVLCLFNNFIYYIN